MIEPGGRTKVTPQQVDRTDQIEFRPEPQSQDKSFEDIAIAMARTHVANALRPPELQFEARERVGGAQFELQAIASIDILKLSSPEETANSLASFIIQDGPDIEKNGSNSAKRGLNAVNTFTQNTALFAAMKAGQGL